MADSTDLPDAGADAPGARPTPDAAPDGQPKSKRSLAMVAATWAFRLFSVAVVVWIALQVEIRDTIETVSRGPITGTIIIDGHAPPADDRSQPGTPWVIRDDSGTEHRVLWRDMRRHDHAHLADGTRVTGTLVEASRDTGLVVLRGDGERETYDARRLGDGDWHYGRPMITRGLASLASNLDAWAILAALGSVVLVLAFASLRWWTLARSVGVDIRYIDAVRLMAIGMFYMYAPGGLATGDLIKAMYLRRHTKRTTEALVSVFADRLLGLQTMLLMGLVAVVGFGWQLIDRQPAFRGVMIATIVLAALGTIAGLLLLSTRMRAALGVNSLLQRGPLARIVGELTKTLESYRNTHGKVALAAVWSIASQVPQVLMAVALGHALGIDVPLWQYFVLVPMASVIGAIPGLPGGLGLMEGGYVAFFAFTLAPEELSRALALSLLMRLAIMTLSAFGFYEAMTFGRRLRQKEEARGGTPAVSTAT